MNVGRRTGYLFHPETGSNCDVLGKSYIISGKRQAIIYFIIMLIQNMIPSNLYTNRRIQIVTTKSCTVINQQWHLSYHGSVWVTWGEYEDVILNDLMSMTIGQGMCKSLVEKGDLDKPLIIFNRTTKRATDLQAKLQEGKTTVVESIEDAVAKADIIFTCLGDDAAITDTITTALKGNVKGKLFVDCSTVHPDTTNKLSRSIEEQGAHFVACPGMRLLAARFWYMALMK